MDSAQLTLVRQDATEKIEQSENLSQAMKCLGKDVEVRMSEMQAQKSALDRQIDASIVLYSQASCRQLCAKIVTTLPRELRDIISKLVVQPDYIYVGPQYLTNEGTPCEKDRDAHFFKESFVEKTMLVELAQAWYRHSLFYFWDKMHNADVVERFMVTDRWGLGIKPHEHISRVRFDLGSKTLHSDGNYCGKRSSFCDVDDFHDLLVGPLKALAHFRIPNRAHFVIRIHTLGSLSKGCLSDIALRSILGDLLTELRVLRSVGHHFVVRWSEMNELEFSSSGSDANSTLTAEEWLKAIKLVRKVA